ncbi:VanZ family protein [Psychromonas aquatilis]|uniref:VanZ family protein n=1 Tax=Psychromonas aquatilis TaxID=2005072 RepID=A0ABU9GT75_9GAMM
MIRAAIQLIRDYWVLLSLLLLTLIVVLSLTPLSKLPSISGSDKVHHFIAYSVLSLPLMLKKPRYWFAVLLIFTVLSGAIEVIQPYTSRYGDWLDLYTNIGGLFCGSILAYFINWCSPAPRLIINNQ